MSKSFAQATDRMNSIRNYYTFLMYDKKINMISNKYGRIGSDSFGSMPSRKVSAFRLELVYE